MNRKALGDKGVSAAIHYYTMLNCLVSVPLSDTTKYDLLVDDGVDIRRVQVKTTQTSTDHGIPVVQLSTQGGNQSWGGVISYISPDKVDEIFVLHLPSKSTWIIPVELAIGKRRFNLGKRFEPYRVWV